MKEIRTLYKFKRKDGGTTVSPKKPEDGVEYTTAFRLVADKNKVLVHNGIVTNFKVLDVDAYDGWSDTDEVNRDL